MTKITSLRQRYEGFVEGCEMLEKDKRCGKFIKILYNNFCKEFYNSISMSNSQTLVEKVITKYERMYIEIIKAPVTNN